MSSKGNEKKAQMLESQNHQSYPSPTSPNLTFDQFEDKPAFPPLTSSLTSPIEPTASDFPYEIAYLSSIFNSNHEYTDDLLSLCMMDFDLSPISPAPPPPSPEKHKCMMEYLMNNEFPIQQQQNALIKVEDGQGEDSLFHLFEEEEDFEPERNVVDPPSIEPAQLFTEVSSEAATVIDLFSDSEEEPQLENYDDLSEYEPALESQDESPSPKPKTPSPPPTRYFICPNPACSKVFNRKYNLNTHIKIHSSDRSRPYHCHYCTASFIRFNDLTRHSTSHSKKKAFWCDGCGGGFTRRDALKRHMKMLGCGDVSLVGKKVEKARMKRD